MKAITVAQPWAELLASGAKSYETRSWKTRYRGPLAIHAAAGISKEAKRLLAESPHLPLPDGMQRGCVLGWGFLVDCVPTEKFAEDMTDRELSYGDWSPGRWAWAIGGIRRIVPKPAKGHLGIWEWDPGMSDLYAGTS